VAALRRADAVGGAGIPGTGVQGVVAALAVGRADGVDRGEVQDVEAHVGDGVDPGHRGPERPGHPTPCREVEMGPLRAGEHLVPGAGLSQPAVHLQGVGDGGGDHVAQGVGGQHGGDVVGQAAGQAVRGLEGGVREDGRGVAQRLGRSRGEVAVRGARQEARSLGEHEIDVDPGVHLDGRVMHPRRVRVRPALHAEGPEARGVRAQPGLVAVQALRDVLHEGPRVVGAVGGHEHGGRGDGVVTLAEDGGAHREGLAHRSLGGPVAVLEDREDLGDGDPADRTGDLRRCGHGRGAVDTHTCKLLAIGPSAHPVRARGRRVADGAHLTLLRGWAGSGGTRGLT